MTLKATFSGTYNFKRHIKPQNIICIGKAYMGWIGEEIIYNELGTIPEINQEFHQTRIFKITNKDFRIYKKDHSLLHEFQLTNQKSELTHTHYCKADSYKIILQIIDENSFIILYNINGPDKNYEIETEFER